MRIGALLAVFFAAAACGRDTARPPSADLPAAAPKPEEPATVRGVVRWKGDDLPPIRITMSGDAYFAGVWPDGGPLDPRFEVAPDGGLPHTFVWVTGETLKSRSWDPPAAPAEITAKRGLYVPHVLGVMTAQPLRLRNADHVNGCFHARPVLNKEFNLGLASGDSKTVTFTKPERAIPIADDCYTWMMSFAFVLDHPFFATTDASGRFEITGLPPGDYVFKVWHEPMTADHKAHEAATKVTLASGAQTALDFELR